MTIPFRNDVETNNVIYPPFDLESTIQQMATENRVIEVEQGQAMTVGLLQQALIKANTDRKPVLLRTARRENGWDYVVNCALQTYEYDEVYIIPQSGINDQFFHIVSLTRVPRLGRCKFVMSGTPIHIGTIPMEEIAKGTHVSTFLDLVLGFYITEINGESENINYEDLTSYFRSLGFVE